MIGKDPKTRRIIVTDLVPPHRQKTKGVHGVGEILSKKEFADYKRKQEEELFILSSAVSLLLRIIMNNEMADDAEVSNGMDFGDIVESLEYLGVEV